MYFTAVLIMFSAMVSNPPLTEAAGIGNYHAPTARARAFYPQIFDFWRQSLLKTKRI